MKLRELILSTKYCQNEFIKGWLPEMADQLFSEVCPEGQNHLHIAAMSGHKIALKYLLRLPNRPPVTIKSNAFKNTPLLWSIANCQIPTSLILLDSKHVPDQDEMRAQINQPCQEGNTPLILSLAKGWHHTNENLYEDQISESVVASKLLELGANVHVKNGRGCTALHYACWHRDIEAIQQLIAQGANLFEVNGEGKTAFELMFSSYDQAKVSIYKCARPFTLDKVNWNQQSMAWKQFDDYRRELGSTYGIEKLPVEPASQLNIENLTIQRSNDYSFFSLCSPSAALVGAAMGALIGAGISALTGGVAIILVAACLGCLVGIVGYMLHGVYSDSLQEESSLNFGL